jgi:hypothetical protein
LQAGVLNGFGAALSLLFALFLLRIILRNELAAGTAWVLFVGVLALTSSLRNAQPESLSIAGVPSLCWGIVQYFVVTRVGWLALLWANFVVVVLGFYPVTFQTSAWYSSAGYTTLFVVAVITVYGFRTSLGRPSTAG